MTMHQVLQPESSLENQFFEQNPFFKFLLLVFMFFAAFNMRIYHLEAPPLDYHPERQYRSALIARGYYYESSSTVPEWKKQIAILNMREKGILEPPIIEILASLAYNVAGAELLWIPRLFSSLFWLIGGAFLYSIAKKLISADAAIFSTVYYLFNPAGVLQSRSFQPESLMTMMMLFSILIILWYQDRPSIRSLAIAAIVSSAALLVKPQCLFPIFGVFIAMEVSKNGVIHTIVSPRVILYFIISLLPAFAFYLCSIFIWGSLQALGQGRFYFNILLNLSFWKGWLAMSEGVLGRLAIIGALVGVMLLRGRLQITVIRGLWVSFFLYGIVFNYSINTHSYYHIQYIPVVALSLGPMAAFVLDRLNGPERKRLHWRVIITAFFIIGIIFSMSATYPKLKNPSSESIVSICKTVGEIVNHSQHTIFLTWVYGNPLEYHGEVAGKWWPAHDDFLLEKYRGLSDHTAEERFNQDYLKNSPEYFIITDGDEFRMQSDLQAFLKKNFAVLAKTNDYLIFDLKKRIGQNNQSQ